MSTDLHVHCGHDGDGLCCSRCIVAPDGVFAPNGETSAPAVSSRSDANDQSAAPLLSLEDRVLVVLSGRGHLRIGQLIENALTEGIVAPLFYITDEALVAALEFAAFEGLHRPSGDDAHRVDPSR